MISPSFQTAHAVTDRAALLELNMEYMAWVVAGLKQSTGAAPPDVVRMGLAPYVASVLDKLCAQMPPQGVFYLVVHDGAVAGMGGLRRVGDAGGATTKITVHVPRRRPLAHGSFPLCGYSVSCVSVVNKF